MALKLLTEVLEQARADAVRTAFVWVLDDNHVARQLYERIGFVSSNHRQLLPLRPGRSEEKLLLTLHRADPP